jgi:hypothetical protein
MRRSASPALHTGAHALPDQGVRRSFISGGIAGSQAPARLGAMSPLSAPFLLLLIGWRIRRNADPYCGRGCAAGGRYQ